MTKRIAGPASSCILMLLLSACAPTPMKISDQHIGVTEPTPTASIPEPLMDRGPDPVNIPVPEQGEKIGQELYSVVVNDVDLRELLFALSRDADLDIDIAPDINGRVTLNAVDQTLFEILERISGMVDIRYQVKNGVLKISADAPYFVHYDISYLNMGRIAESQVSISTEVATTGVGAQSSGGDGTNSSATVISNSSSNQFWRTLTRNIHAILNGGDSFESLFGENGGESDTVRASQSDSSEGGEEGDSDSESAQSPDRDTSIVVNSETGVMSIKASQKQHRLVQAFLDRITDGAQRQVLIEASIVEVNLNDAYKAGVDWSRLVQSGSSGLSYIQDLVGSNLSSAPVTSLTYTGGGKHDLSATVDMLSEFGNTKVLSTPKLMVLNNQTALLKVVDNLVYFSIDVEEDVQEGIINRTFTSEIHTVPVGLVMSVTPHISRGGEVTLNVRPTISRVLRFVEDPNPALASSNVKSLVPEISVREMESVMRINGGDTAVIGGLMQDTQGDTTSGVPGLAKLPFVGDAFAYKDNEYVKSELIVFIRPIVVKKASLASAELSAYSAMLPDAQTRGGER